MSTAATVAAAVARRGQPVVVRRQLTVQPPTWADVVVAGVWRAYGVKELVAGIAQGDHLVVLAEQALADKGFPVPLRRGDTVVLDPVIVDGAWTPGTGARKTVENPGHRGPGTGFWAQVRG